LKEPSLAMGEKATKIFNRLKEFFILAPILAH
jgi:hypothetical protein